MRESENMKKECEYALDLARKANFQAAVIDVSQIVFDEGFRKYCEENLCGQYNANYSCPPECGTPEEMREEACGYIYALVVKSEWQIPDWKDAVRVKQAKKQHNEAMLQIIYRMNEMKIPCRMGGASCCTLCEQCAALTDEPCRFPEKKFSCLSAYCINVSKLAEAAGMDYSWEEGGMGLYGMILMGKR